MTWSPSESQNLRIRISSEQPQPELPRQSRRSIQLPTAGPRRSASQLPQYRRGTIHRGAVTTLGHFGAAAAGDGPPPSQDGFICRTDSSPPLYLRHYYRRRVKTRLPRRSATFVTSLWRATVATIAPRRRCSRPATSMAHWRQLIACDNRRPPLMKTGPRRSLAFRWRKRSGRSEKSPPMECLLSHLSVRSISLFAITEVLWRLYLNEPGLRREAHSQR